MNYLKLSEALEGLVQRVDNVKFINKSSMILVTLTVKNRTNRFVEIWSFTMTSRKRNQIKKVCKDSCGASYKLLSLKTERI